MLTLRAIDTRPRRDLFALPATIRRCNDGSHVAPEIVELGAAFVWAAGRGSTRNASAGATPEPGAGQTQAPQPAATPQQNWGSCSQFIDDTSDIPTAKCTTVSVPIDYANPVGAQAKLAVIRIPATGQRIGSLFVNPGGPGASAVEMVAGMAGDHLHRRRSRPARIHE